MTSHPHNPQDNVDKPKSLQINAIQHTDWQQHAACKGATHLMFPKEHKDITYLIQARAICAGCPVKDPCLNYALTFPAGDMHGVWAGLTPRQLAAEQRRRNLRPTVKTIAQAWADINRGGPNT